MPKPTLCVTVTADTTAQLRQRRDRVEHADLIELRVDLVRDPDAVGALAGRNRTPVIVTCRAAWEGGGFKGSEEERKAVLQAASAAGADYIDVEWSAGFQDLIDERRGKGVVISMHDFSGIPADLDDRVASMRRSGAEVVKVAVTPTRLTDVTSLCRFTRDASAATVLIGMGDAGLVTRIVPSRVGSAWTYAGDAVAPGQIPPARLLDEFSFQHVTDRTALYGVVGRPVTHSLSPAMHNAAFQSLGIDAVYLPLAAADYDDFLSFAETFGVQGASVTAPYKVEAFERARQRDEVSERVGAVNTLKRRGDQWLARNTDVDGFLAPLVRDGIALAGIRATVLGAGGASRAVVEALRGAGAVVTVCSRRTGWPPAPGAWDLLVNATPVGTAPAVGDTPLPGGPFTGGIVYDLVYNPCETRLLREARLAGCRTIGGLDMLVAQAVKQCEWWTAAPAPAGVMRTAATRALERSGGDGRASKGLD